MFLTIRGKPPEVFPILLQWEKQHKWLQDGMSSLMERKAKKDTAEAEGVPWENKYLRGITGVSRAQKRPWWQEEEGETYGT